MKITEHGGMKRVISFRIHLILPCCHFEMENNVNVVVKDVLCRLLIDVISQFAMKVTLNCFVGFHSH